MYETGLNGLRLTGIWWKVSEVGKGINVVRIFCPEHGFRGTADAGETVGDYIDAGSGLKVVSLYGKKKKPQPEDLSGIDVMIFDMQDVGVRFYTYLSTLHYVMEACVLIRMLFTWMARSCRKSLNLLSGCTRFRSCTG